MSGWVGLRVGIGPLVGRIIRGPFGVGKEEKKLTGSWTSSIVYQCKLWISSFEETIPSPDTRCIRFP